MDGWSVSGAEKGSAPLRIPHLQAAPVCSHPEVLPEEAPVASWAGKMPFMRSSLQAPFQGDHRGRGAESPWKARPRLGQPAGECDTLVQCEGDKSGAKREAGLRTAAFIHVSRRHGLRRQPRPPQKHLGKSDIKNSTRKGAFQKPDVHRALYSVVL